MKKILGCILICCAGFISFSQNTSNNTLLWRISGKDISQPSYLFGTIHLLCADEIELSDSLKSAIAQSSQVYLELDMDNMLEMLQAVKKMKMRNDTTLSDLLSAEDYEKVKAYFKGNKSIIPFSILETYKPMLAASTLMHSSIDCDNAISMEELIMRHAKKEGKGIKGMETMAYQLSIFDSIPYKLQAQQLLEFVNDQGKEDASKKEYAEMMNAYRMQQLDKLEALINRDEFGVTNFTEVLLYNRNSNWVKKMQQMLGGKPLVIAVGAGHLPGDKGVINLLRKAGYTVEPVENRMEKKTTKVI